MPKRINKKPSLATFENRRDDILDMLRAECERKPKTKEFDPTEAWDQVEFMALRYFQEKIRIEEKETRTPAAACVELLEQLGEALKEARCRLDDALRHNVRGCLFLEWSEEAHGGVDWTAPPPAVENEFEQLPARLHAIERAAFRAAEEWRQPRHRPVSSPLSQDFIQTLAFAYKNITGKRAGAGGSAAGPFARFVKCFFEAVGLNYAETTVIDKVAKAKKTAGTRWGKGIFET
jgi:hypothetical protein